MFAAAIVVISAGRGILLHQPVARRKIRWPLGTTAKCIINQTKVFQPRLCAVRMDRCTRMGRARQRQVFCRQTKPISHRGAG